MEATKQHSFKKLLLGSLLLVGIHSQAQDWKTEKRANLVFGLTQSLIVSGFNVEGNYIHNLLIFDYSHGVSLDFNKNTVTGDLKRQGLVVHLPYTTGFGVGYRFTEWLNLRVEPKWHRFEVYYDGEPQNKGNDVTSFNTFSMGLGLYGSYRPFKNKTSFLNGFLIAPSIRFWPTLTSTLKDNKFNYINKKTETNEEIKTLDPGIGFTPLVINISIGYSFNVKKKN